MTIKPAPSVRWTKVKLDLFWAFLGFIASVAFWLISHFTYIDRLFSVRASMAYSGQDTGGLIFGIVVIYAVISIAVLIFMANFQEKINSLFIENTTRKIGRT